MRKNSICLSLLHKRSHSLCTCVVEVTRKTCIYLVLFSCFLLFPLLIACDKDPSGIPYQHILHSPTAIPPASVERVDWSNFTYTFTCYTTRPVTIRLHNGSAQQNGVTYSVLKPVFGELTGTGQLAAVIIFQCTAADAAPAQAFVYGGTAQYPTLLAILPPDEHAHFGVRAASISHGILQLSGDGYTAQDPLCCPSLKVITRYKWNGTHFNVLNAEAFPVAPPKT